MQKAFDELGEAGFEDAIRAAHVGLMLSDATRSDPRQALLPRVARLLRTAERVTAFVCTGTHDPRMPENVELAQWIQQTLESEGLAARVIVNDARDPAKLRFGSTSRGTPIEVHPASSECAAFLVLSDMKTHYFAGYSNPVKSYLPGIASFEAARGNHSLALQAGATFCRHPWHPEQDRRDNPLAEDMVEAFDAIVGARPHFALCSVSGGGEILWAGGGRTQSVAGRGMLAVDERMLLETEPARYLIVSAGGHPLDESLYTAQRALELTREALLPGAEVLFLARCPNGIGPPSARENFFDRLQAPIAEVLSSFEGEYVMYSHKAWKFADYLSKVARVHLRSELEPAEVRSIHLEPLASTEASQAVVDGWARAAANASVSSDRRVLIVEDASKLAIRSRYRST